MEKIIDSEKIELYKTIINSSIKASYVYASSSILGGKERATLILTLSFDDKSSWEYNILENSRYIKIIFYYNGRVECVSQSNRLLKLRAFKVNSVNDFILKINRWILKNNCTVNNSKVSSPALDNA